MRSFTLLWMLSMALVLHAQESSDTLNTKNKTAIYFHIGAGPNWEKNPNLSNIGYGIHIAESTLRTGFYTVFGARFVFKEKFDLGAQFVSRTQSRNQRAFFDHFDNLYPNKDVLFSDDKIEGPLRFGIQLSFGYTITLKSIKITPKVCIGATIGPQVYYNYVLRTKGTNYFDEYRVNNRSKGEYPVSIGFNFSHEKAKWLQFSAEIGYSKNRNMYSISNIGVDESYGEPADEIITFNHSRLFFSIGLHFNLRLR